MTAHVVAVRAARGKGLRGRAARRRKHELGEEQRRLRLDRRGARVRAVEP